MDTRFRHTSLPHSQTGKFSKIVLDYLSEDPELRPFYAHDVTIDGIKAAIKTRQSFDTDRKALVQHLRQQYQAVETSEKTHNNIEALLQHNSFTICTAHQPNIFTGHLYFIYKILHTIRLSAHLNEQLPDYHFVPVYFMGNEDADLEELNHIVWEGKQYTWNTRQKGAVGKMLVDEALLELMQQMEGRLLAEPHGADVMKILRESFTEGRPIEEAMLHLVNALFSQYGLIILMAGAPALKQQSAHIFQEDLLTHQPASIVRSTSEKLDKQHSAQAFVRDINLFYMKDDLRNRIETDGETFRVVDTDIYFNKEEILAELEQHPERFSPNVILRGIFQESILPDVAFIGGGGELAYWFQLKDLFTRYGVPYPVLVLRNSMLIVEGKSKQLLDKTDLKITDVFGTPDAAMEIIVDRESNNSLQIDEEEKDLKNVYRRLEQKTLEIDPTLSDFVQALQTRHGNDLKNLEKKMLRAEKRKFSDRRRQVDQLFAALSPDGGLQERVENYLLFAAKYRPALMYALYEASMEWGKEFVVVEEEPPQYCGD